MFSRKIYKSLLVCTVLLGIFVRFYKIGDVPPSFNIDELTEAYNATSLVQTGFDKYGKFLPIAFKSYDSFQPPLYTYLSALVFKLLGGGFVQMKVVSLFSGLVILYTSLLVAKLVFKEKEVPIFVFLVVAISPWSIFFSRVATEAVLGLALYCVGIYFAIGSLKDSRKLIPTVFFLGMSTHAYYSERLSAPLFLVFLILLFHKNIFKNIKLMVSSGAIFLLTQIPHLYSLQTGLFLRRFEQVAYIRGDSSLFELFREFFSHYLSYLSPRNLFFYPDVQAARSIPDLSVFYSWMVIPLFLGLYYLVKRIQSKSSKVLFLAFFVSIIPASLAKDPFYTLRVQETLWLLSFVIGVGFWKGVMMITSQKLRYVALALPVIWSVIVFYNNYFVLFKSERSREYGYHYYILANKLESLSPDQQVVVDLSREIYAGTALAVYLNFDPARYQSEIGKNYLINYYDSYDHEKTYNFDNISVRPIVWKDDTCRELLLVGDYLALSEEQVVEHKLIHAFDIYDLAGKQALKGYYTNPEEKCAKQKLT